MTPIQQAITSLSLLQAISEGVQGMTLKEYIEIRKSELAGRSATTDEKKEPFMSCMINARICEILDIEIAISKGEIDSL